MKTKFGNAKIYDGYYVITTKKEGNGGKKLHRLIWEDFWGCEIPKGYVIHHRDNNPLNNCILNLQLIKAGEHNKLHANGENHPMYGKYHSDGTKRKMSEAKNTSGYFRVCKIKHKNYKQGFGWRYSYYENGKRKCIDSVDLKKLEAKVKSKGLLWEKLKSGEF